MSLGNKNLILTFLIYTLMSTSIFSEDKILSSPLINLDDLKPSFEETDEKEVDSKTENIILKKKKFSQKNNLPTAKFIGLDKITAKTSEIVVNLGEAKKFGPLEIKVLKCGKVLKNKISDNVAYLQVKDLSKNDNEKVFIFNGWTFSSDPNLTPFDHAIYDLQLINCDNV